MTIETHINRIIKVDTSKADTNLASRGEPYNKYQLLYRCPTYPANKSAVIHSLSCANITGSEGSPLVSQAIYPTVLLQDVSRPTIYEFHKLGDRLKIPPFSTLVWDKPINLESGDAIYVDTSSLLNESANILVSAMEFFANTFEKYKNFSMALDKNLSLICNCPMDKSNVIIHGLQFANIDRLENNTYSDATVVFEDIDSTQYIIANNIKIPPNSNFIWDKPITLIPGQSLYAKTNNVKNVHCVASILEIAINI